jgi:hypothetical protein
VYNWKRRSPALPLKVYRRARFVFIIKNFIESNSPSSIVAPAVYDGSAVFVRRCHTAASFFRGRVARGRRTESRLNISLLLQLSLHRSSSVLFRPEKCVEHVLISCFPQTHRLYYYYYLYHAKVCKSFSFPSRELM